MCLYSRTEDALRHRPAARSLKREETGEKEGEIFRQHPRCSTRMSRNACQLIVFEIVRSRKRHFPAKPRLNLVEARLIVGG